MCDHLTSVLCTAGKFDLAQENLRRALTHDKSCSKAWEYMGLIMEKEAAYKDAAENYEQVRPHWAASLVSCFTLSTPTPFLSGMEV